MLKFVLDCVWKTTVDKFSFPIIVTANTTETLVTAPDDYRAGTIGTAFLVSTQNRETYSMWFYPNGTVGQVLSGQYTQGGSRTLIKPAILLSLIFQETVFCFSFLDTNNIINTTGIY